MNWVHSLNNFATRLCAGIHESSAAVDQQSSSGHFWLDKQFTGFALELFGIQFRCNQVYRGFCANRGVSLESVEHWSDIPAVPTAAFKEWDVSCLPENDRSTVFFSSGTTGQLQSRHYHNARSLEVYETSLRQWFQANLQRGIVNKLHTSMRSERDRPEMENRFRTALSLTPSQAAAPNSSLVHMFETLRKDRIAHKFTFTGQVSSDGAWSLDLPETVSSIEVAIAAKQEILLLGTAFSYVHLIDYLANNGLSFQLPAGSVLLETGGYKGRSRALPKQAFYTFLTQQLGVPSSRIVCEYGMSELSSQAYDLSIWPGIVDGGFAGSEPAKAINRLFRFPPWARVQIISPETGSEVAEGETGLIRVFDLANVYSVMAIQTEDLAVRREGGFELIGRATSSEPRGCSLMSV